MEKDISVTLKTVWRCTREDSKKREKPKRKVSNVVEVKDKIIHWNNKVNEKFFIIGYEYWFDNNELSVTLFS